MDRFAWLRSAVWIAEAVPFAFLCLVFRLLPVATAARLGGCAMALIGPRLRKHRHIRHNLSIVLAHASGGRALDEAELEHTARAVWRNLGAVIAEYPHLEAIARRRTTVSLPASVRALIDSRQRIVALSAHLANWEIIPVILTDAGLPLSVVYSPQANPLIERLIGWMRPSRRCRFLPKLDAARSLLRAASEGDSLGVLADLRVDSGSMLPFFEVSAATTTVPIRIALRAGCTLVPLHVEREPGSRFKVVFDEPLPVAGDGADAAAEATQGYLACLERWIAARPGEWLCTKRRWPKGAAAAVPGR